MFDMFKSLRRGLLIAVGAAGLALGFTAVAHAHGHHHHHHHHGHHHHGHHHHGHHHHGHHHHIYRYIHTGYGRCSYWRNECSSRWGYGTYSYGRCMWRHGC